MAENKMARVAEVCFSRYLGEIFTVEINNDVIDARLTKEGLYKENLSTGEWIKDNDLLIALLIGKAEVWEGI